MLAPGVRGNPGTKFCNGCDCTGWHQLAAWVSMAAEPPELRCQSARCKLLGVVPAMVRNLPEKHPFKLLPQGGCKLPWASKLVPRELEHSREAHMRLCVQMSSIPFLFATKGPMVLAIGSASNIASRFANVSTYKAVLFDDACQNLVAGHSTTVHI